MIPTKVYISTVCTYEGRGNLLLWRSEELYKLAFTNTKLVLHISLGCLQEGLKALLFEAQACYL